MMDAYKLTIAKASKLIREGSLSPTNLIDSVLKRIEIFEDKYEAWVTVDVEKVIEFSERLTKEAEEGVFRGSLHGIPVGVKDIFYTKNLRTTMGSTIYKDFVPKEDAESVKRLKIFGAIVLGKTETTEFAYADPAPTRNPWNLEHTPGGSSSGSAAAVSLGMCQTALGSQTGGSVIRPAAFCGVVGMKPTYDLISRNGVYPLSWSLDHVGFFTRTVKDAAIILNTLSGRNYDSSGFSRTPRIGLLIRYFEDRAEFEVWEGLEKSIERFRNAGAEIIETPLPDCFDFVHSAHSVIFAAEAASVHGEMFKSRMKDYRVHIRGLVASGLLVPASAYLKALRIKGKFMGEVLSTLKDFDCLITPSSLTPALKGLESTGDASFNSPWSFCGFPSITIPCCLTRRGLPIGVQLIAGPFDEEKLLRIARWCESTLGFKGEPLEF